MGEQPLPPYGACLLGSFNLVKYTDVDLPPYIGQGDTVKPKFKFNYDQLKEDIPHVVRAMDNVIDRTEYPLVEQEREAKAKRRMGLGVTGLANTLTLLGLKYGSPEAVKLTRKIMKTLTCAAYEASIELAKEKGCFQLYGPRYIESPFIKRLPQDLQEGILKHGIRNSHLTSIAPTGTISFTADNISSGIEPVFANEVARTVITEEGPIIVPLKDYAWNYYRLRSVESSELTTDEHLAMQIAVQPWVDSAVSKTVNVGDDVTFDEFKEVYMKAWKGKLKGVTTYRAAGKRYGVLNKIEPDDDVVEDGAACFIDSETGMKECG